MTSQAELDATINQMAEALRPLVAKIEALPLTTQHHYGDYISALSVLAERSPGATKSTFIGLGVALQRAGANKAGVLHALRVMGHL